MKKTLIGCNSFTNKQGKPCYLLHYTQPFNSNTNSYGMSTSTEFVNSDIFQKSIQLVGSDVVIDYERNGSFFKAIDIRRIEEKGVK